MCCLSIQQSMWLGKLFKGFIDFSVLLLKFENGILAIFSKVSEKNYVGVS